MSDINHSRMIPLHIADQAVAACEKEIAGLKAENARLKAEVERLTVLQVETIDERNKAEAEVERLRKAGDKMAEALNLNDDVFDNQDKREAQANWQAAKETPPNA